MFPRRRFSYPWRLLLFGALLIVMGGVLLLWTNGLLPSFGALWPLLLLAAGIWQLDHALVSDGREATVLTGMVFTLSGIFVLLRTTQLLDVAFDRIWPVFMAIAGLSLLAYGFKKGPGYRAAVMVPAVAILFLSAVFLLFSLDAVETSFIRFVGKWWPSLLVLLGILFLLRGIPHLGTTSLAEPDEAEQEDDEP